MGDRRLAVVKVALLFFLVLCLLTIIVGTTWFLWSLLGWPSAFIGLFLVVYSVWCWHWMDINEIFRE